MRRNPLLYSDHSDTEDINTIEPIEEKRSFIFYFIVLANSLLVILVLLIIWSLFSKTSDTSFDQQLKVWTQQVFNNTENSVDVKAAIAPPKKVDTPAEQAITQEKALEELEIEKAEEALAIKAEQEKQERAVLQLKEEKEAALRQQAIDEAKNAEVTALEEAKVVPNAAQNITEEPTNTTKTQLEQILETMQTQ